MRSKGESDRVCPSVCLSAKNLRWRELTTFRTSKRIRRFENAPIYLSVPATGLTRSHSLGFLLFSYYPVHFVSHFFYGHQSRPQIICHVYTHINFMPTPRPARRSGMIWIRKGSRAPICSPLTLALNANVTATRRDSRRASRTVRINDFHALKTPRYRSEPPKEELFQSLC